MIILPIININLHYNYFIVHRSPEYYRLMIEPTRTQLIIIAKLVITSAWSIEFYYKIISFSHTRVSVNREILIPIKSDL